MSFSNLPSLVIEPRWSRQRSGLLLASVVIGAVAPWLIPHWSAAACWLLSLSSLIILAMGFYRAGWWGKRRLIRVTWQQSGEWRLDFAQREAHHPHPNHSVWADLRDDSYVNSWLVLLRWQVGAGGYSLMLIRGELPAAAWRQWQVRLRLEAGRKKVPVTSGARD